MIAKGAVFWDTTPCSWVDRSSNGKR